MDYMENNRALVIGKVATPFIFSHELFGEKYYTFRVVAERESGTEDIIPCMISDRLTNTDEDLTGRLVRIDGNFRSRNDHTDEEHSKLILSLFAQEFEVIEDGVDLVHVNTIRLVGYICKKPIFRMTPKGREICDFLLAVNYRIGKSAYIPCIAWGRNARFVDTLEISTKAEVLGRIQSREYVKRHEDGSEEVKVAYEISVQLVEV